VNDPTDARSDAVGLVPVDVSSRLLRPSEVFDPELFATEMVRVHGRSWILLGDVEDLAMPGDFLTGRIGMQSVVVVRDDNDAVRGFLNTCRHRASRLCDGAAGSTGRYLTCPYHQWSYRLDGSLASVPDQERMFGPSFDREQFGLVPIRVEVAWGTLIFGCLSSRTPPLREFLGPLAERYDRMGFEHVKRHHRELDETYEMNWKVFIENSNDDYHVRFVHRRPGSNIDPMGTRNRADGFTCSSYKPYDDTLDPGDGFPDGPAFDATGFFADFVFPSVNPLVPAPGTLVTVRNEPVSPTRTRLVSRVYTSDGDGVAADELLDEIDRTNREDTTMIASLMENLRSPYFNPGPAARWEARCEHVMDLARSERARPVDPGEFVPAPIELSG
jgi:phenylpropionate dioxygenase-like ring-hydroxylating dioxygenase large terminal subunit